MASSPLINQSAGYGGPPVRRLSLVPTEDRKAAHRQVATGQPRLSAVDWSIVALAERDSLASLREPGRLAKAVELLFGLGRPNKLASSRSETLRRVAVWCWRRGGNVPQGEVNGFLEAGFTLDQLDLIRASISQGRHNMKSRRNGR